MSCKIFSCKTIEEYVKERMLDYTNLSSIGLILNPVFKRILDYTLSVKEDECGIFMVYEYVYTEYTNISSPTGYSSVDMMNKVIGKQLQIMMNWMNGME